MFAPPRSPLAALGLLVIVFTCVGCSAGRNDVARRAERLNSAKQEAQIALDAGDYQAAVDILSPLAEEKIHNGQLYAMLARAYWRMGEYELAVDNYQTSLEQHFESAETHLDFATMLMEMGRTGRAMTEFEQAVQFSVRNPVAHYNYGLALHAAGRTEEALAQWEIAENLDPSDARYAEALGIGYSGRDDAKARRYFERAAELGANSAGFHNNYGLLLRRQGLFAEARAQFEHAVEIDPSHAPYRANLAVACMQAAAYDRAIGYWSELLREDGDRRTYRIYLARSYMEAGRYRDAVATLSDWLPTQKTTPQKSDSWSKFDWEQESDIAEPPLDEAYDVLGMSYRGLGELDDAERHLARAVALAPENTSHLNNYGVVLAENGKIDQAKSQWRQVLALDPGNMVARENLSAVEP